MSWRPAFLTLPMVAFAWTNVGAQTMTVQVTVPPDNAQVAQRDTVEGTVLDPSADVWVLIKPLMVGDYYVQPHPTVHPTEGSWRIIGHFGDEDTPSGEPFEIVAIANPERPLRPGDRLAVLPASDAQSPPVPVTRQ